MNVSKEPEDISIWYSKNKDHYDTLFKSLFDLAKPYCTYMLLDSRVSKEDCSFEQFKEAIFLVSQVSAENVEKARRFLNKVKDGLIALDTQAGNIKVVIDTGFIDSSSGNTEIIKRILEIWKGGRSVMCLKTSSTVHIQESRIKKALLIDALGLDRLCNVNNGSYSSCDVQLEQLDKRRMGDYFLKESFLKFREGCAEELPGNIQGLEGFIDRGLLILEFIELQNRS